MESNLLYLNLAIDKNDTSLGFASSWIEEISKLYSNIDVVTLRLGEIPELPKNVNLYGPKSSKNKFHSALKIKLPKKLQFKKFSRGLLKEKFDLIVIALSLSGIDFIGKELKKFKKTLYLFF